MATERRPPIVSKKPEINLARRLLYKHELTPPIDALSLVQQYADVSIRNIPIDGVDGVSLDIKVPGKTPRVIVDDSIPPTRRLFTLAHELGHILIPGHVGTIPDMLSFSLGEGDGVDTELVQQGLSALGEYMQMEQEANSFASELLMPEEWIQSLEENRSSAQLHEAVCQQARVSPQAACIRLELYLPPGVVYCCIEADDNTVSFSGRSIGTLVSPPSRGPLHLSDSFAHAIEHGSWQSAYNTYHWWKFSTEVSLIDSDPREWRTVLHSIVEEQAPTGSNIPKIKHRINCIIAAANDAVLKSDRLEYTEEAVIAASIQRVLNREDLTKYANHPDFKMVVKKRAVELYANQKK